MACLHARCVRCGEKSVRHGFNLNIALSVVAYFLSRGQIWRHYAGGHFMRYLSARTLLIISRAVFRNGVGALAATSFEAGGRLSTSLQRYA